MRIFLCLTVFLLTAFPARAALNDFQLSLPSYMQMHNVMDSASFAHKALIQRIASPNQMIALFFPDNAQGQALLPDDLIIMAVPAGNPHVSAADFPLLKKELRPRMLEAGAFIFKDEPGWMGATKQQSISGQSYILSTAIVALKDHVLMMQYLRKSSSSNDYDLLHNVVTDIVLHLRSHNQDRSEPQQRAAQIPDEAKAPRPSKPKPLYVPQ